MISIEDYLSFVDEALDGMVDILTELGDDRANRRPALPGANSPYAIVTHCLGVMNYWAGYLATGRSIERDRDAEFRASGPVDALVEQVQAARRQFGVDVAGIEPFAPPRGVPDPEDRELPLARTQGGSLFHVYEELAQHRGQLELTRDVLLAQPS